MKAPLSVEVTFNGPIPDVTNVPGVTAVTIDGWMLRCQVRGPIQPLLAVLASAQVTPALHGREPSLEELFLESSTATAPRLTRRAPLESALASLKRHPPRGPTAGYKALS